MRHRFSLIKEKTKRERKSKYTQRERDFEIRFIYSAPRTFNKYLNIDQFGPTIIYLGNKSKTDQILYN